MSNNRKSKSNGQHECQDASSRSCCEHKAFPPDAASGQHTHAIFWSCAEGAQENGNGHTGTAHEDHSDKSIGIKRRLSRSNFFEALHKKTLSEREQEEEKAGDTTGDATSIAEAVTEEIPKVEMPPPADTTAEDPWDDTLGPPPKVRRKIWEGFSGLAVTGLGIAAPAFLGALFIFVCAKRLTLVLLNHPVETTIEFLLLCTIPLANFMIWSAICKHDFRFSWIRGSLLGAGIFSSFALAAVSFAAIPAGYTEMSTAIGTSFSTGFLVFGSAGLMSGAAGLYLLYRMRAARELNLSRLRVVVCASSGILIALAALVACEARAWYVRLAESDAVSPVAVRRESGLSTLRQMDTERELRMECSDPRSVGLSGLFMPIKKSALPKLYFAVTGKPFSDINSSEMSTMSEEFLRRHVVGPRLDKLTLVRSKLDGEISPSILTSTLHWTMVFQNDFAESQEARAEFVVPAGAAVTGLTLWHDGEPADSTFIEVNGTGGPQYGVSSSIPASISDLGRGRYLVTCGAVSPEEQVKLRISIVAPLNPESGTQANLLLPRLVATNFVVAGEHEAAIASPETISTNVDNLGVKRLPDGQYQVVGTLKDSQIEGAQVMLTAHWSGKDVVAAAPDSVSRSIAQKALDAEKARKDAEAKEEAEAAGGRVVVMIDGSNATDQQLSAVNSAISNGKQARAKALAAAKKTAPMYYVVKRISQVASRRPGKVVVVVDGSQAVASRRAEIVTALKSISPKVDTTVLVASEEEALEPMPLNNALNKLGSVRFAGGQDNLKAMVKAAGIAGEAEDSVVLWIHGPQPALNGQIYITSPFAHKPAFYELSLDEGETNTAEYFKHHAEIGPFAPVPLRKGVTQSLRDLFAKWDEGRKVYAVSYQTVTGIPTGTPMSGRGQTELVALGNLEKVRQLMQQKLVNTAAEQALAHGVVSPFSSALISNERRPSNSEEGASDEAAVIQGVNTSGTVRVNNLANLEALLNILANGAELAFGLTGLAMVLDGAIRRGVATIPVVGVRLNAAGRVVAGLILLTGGLAVPGIINWFVASARDANLFT